MAAPLLVPLILLGGATIALAAASGKKKKEPPANVRTYTLDQNMPGPLRDQVLAALASEEDPARLDAFATAIAGQFPLAASALRQKAAMLRAGTLPQNPLDLLVNVPDPPRSQVVQQLMGQSDPNALEAYAAQLEGRYPAAAAALRMKAALLRGQAPQVQPPTPSAPLPTAPPIVPNPPSPMPAPSSGPVPLPPGQLPQLQNVDPGFPPEYIPLLQASYQDPDPAHIEAYAATIASLYPIAAGLLRARAAQLRASTPSPMPPARMDPQPQPAPPATQPAPPMPVPPAVQPAPQPLPTPPAVIQPQLLGGLDPNMPPEMQKAVVGALTTESDPAKLEGFASAIQAQYPVAAGLLAAKAQALRLARPVPMPPAPVPMPSVPSVPSSSVPIYPVGDDTTRSGRNAGRPVGKYPFIVLGTRGPGNAPVTIAKYGAGSEAEYAKLQPINPQYRLGRDPEFIGQALNVPWEWAGRLASAGYVVQQDPGATPPMLAVSRPLAALPAGGTYAAHA